MQVLSNRLVETTGCVADIAIDLRLARFRRLKTKTPPGARLPPAFERHPNRSFGRPAAAACRFSISPPENPGASRASANSIEAGSPDSSGGIGSSAGVNQAIQKRSGGDNHGLQLPIRRPSCISTPRILSFCTTKSTTMPCRRCRFGVFSRVARISVRYSARSAWARGDCTAGPRDRFSKPKLDPGAVNDPAHDSAERVDLPHQMALCDPANRRITGHLADEIEVQRHQCSLRAQARGGRGRLATGVAAANHYHIKNFVKSHHYFPMQNVLNISDKNILGCRLSGYLSQKLESIVQANEHKLLARVLAQQAPSDSSSESLRAPQEIIMPAVCDQQSDRFRIDCCRMAPV